MLSHPLALLALVLPDGAELSVGDVLLYTPGGWAK